MGWWKESGQAVAKLTNLGRSRTWACMRRREVGRGRCRRRLGCRRSRGRGRCSSHQEKEEVDRRRRE
jgi:hypothetical protein